jgi:branched-chain amino acid transport system permease protein
MTALFARARWPLLALLVPLMPFTGLVPPYWIALFNYISIASLVALGLVLLTGVGGMTSFGQAAFVGFGAYTSAVLTIDYGWSPWLTLPACLAVTASGAFSVGLITVRLSGHYLPLGTIAWGIAFYYLFGTMSLLGARDGLSGIPPLRVGALDLIEPKHFFVIAWLFVLASLLATRNLLDSRVGRAIRALRRSAVAAEAFGVDTTRIKLVVFVYAALLAGLAGWLYAHFQRSVAPGAFSINVGVEYLLMAVVGGSGRIYGALFGATVIMFLRDQLQTLLPFVMGASGNYETIVFGIVLILILQTAPSGLWPFIQRSPDSTPTIPKGRDDLPRRAMPPPGAPLLDAKALRMQFGGLVAVNDVSFQLNAGEIIGLIGPNGAGKSTTFNLLTGVLRPTAGEAEFAGRRITGLPPHEIARLGIARSFQHAHIAPDMTVLENVALGSYLRGSAGALRSLLRLDRPEEEKLLLNAQEQLERVGLGAQALLPAGTLALGQMRLLEVARALCLDPSLLLLDEPAAGLRVGEKRALANLLRDLRAQGMSVLLVEHDMDFVMSLADRLIVLDFGSKIAEGVPNSVRANEKVLEAYLGGAA